MLKLSRVTIAALLALAACASLGVVRAQEKASPSSASGRSAAVPAQQQQAAPALDQWADDFDGDALDAAKWERFSFEGGGGGKIEVKGGQLRLRSTGKSRAGVRSKQTFDSDRFIVEARVAKVGPALPEQGDKSAPLGFAALTLMFDGSGRNRVEWVLTSEGTFEAWAIVDGRSERIDNRKLGTKLKNPVLAIVRRGDEFLFVLNGPDSPAEQAQVGLTKVIKNLPRTFHVMLYGFSSSENNWDSVRVTAAK